MGYTNWIENKKITKFCFGMGQIAGSKHNENDT